MLGAVIGFEEMKMSYLLLTLVTLGAAQDLSNLGRDIEASVQQSLAPLRNLGPTISNRVSESLAPLNNLGAQIQHSVYEGLEPVRALEDQNKMKNGIGGTTIVRYLPKGTVFVVRDNVYSLCSGDIDETTGACSGNLSPFQWQDQKDYCFMHGGYSIVNDKICVGASSISIINNEITCRNNGGPPALLLDLESFRNMCRDVATRAQYRYIADIESPYRVQIPNRNRFVKCNNNEPGICNFEEDIGIPQNNGRSGRVILQKNGILFNNIVY